MAKMTQNCTEIVESASLRRCKPTGYTAKRFLDYAMIELTTALNHATNSMKLNNEYTDTLKHVGLSAVDIGDAMRWIELVRGAFTRGKSEARNV